MTPTTKAGQVLLEALTLLDRMSGAPPVDWSHGIAIIEQEAATAVVMARAGDLCLCGHQRSEHHTGDARFRTAPKPDL